MPNDLKQLLQLPKFDTTADDLLPEELWPSLPGIKEAELLTVEPTLSSWQAFWKNAAQQPLVAVDTETSGLRPFHGDRLVGVSAAYYRDGSIHGGYWNFRHHGHPKHRWCQKYHRKDPPLKKKLGACEKCDAGWCPGYKEEIKPLPLSALRCLEPAFKSCIIAGQNFKFDCKILWQDGVSLPERVLDTLLIAHLWDENRGHYNLDSLAQEIGEAKLTDTVAEYAAKHGFSVEATGHAQIPFKVEQPYAIRDVVLVLKRLQFERWRWFAERDPKLAWILQVESLAVPTFAAMEISGTQLDLIFVKQGIARLEAELAQLQKLIFKKAGQEFDILSTDQLWQVLQARGFKPIAWTPTKKPQLDNVAMTAYNDEFCNLVKAYRDREKMLGTYFKPFLVTHADSAGIIHSDFFIHGTVAGRASSREPNLQNIPRFEKFGSRTRLGIVAKALQEGLKTEVKKSGETLETRKCFVPRSSKHALIFADYSQMELRVFSEYAGEQFMIDTIISGGDVHEATAREIFPSFPEKKDNLQVYEYFRQLTKQVNFGIIYGMGQAKLAFQLNVPVDEATRYLELYLKALDINIKIAKNSVSSALTREAARTYLEDLRVARQARHWEGLRALAGEVQRQVDPAPLEVLLLKDNENLRLTYSAETFLKRYHQRFPKIKEFTREIDRTIATRGYVFSRFGRRSHLTRERSYVGVNRLVQGLCGDIIKIAQWRCYQLLKGTRSHIINQVHDELQFDLHLSDLKLIPAIKQCMEHFPMVQVPIVVDIDYSLTSWADKHEWNGAEALLAEHKKLYGNKRSA